MRTGFWVIVMLLVWAPVAGAVDDFEEISLEDLLNTVVSAAKHEQDISVSPAAITVIGRDQIENSHCTDLVCLLRQVPEIDVLRIKPMYSAVGARGLTDEAADKVLLLIDGQEFNNEVFGLVFWQALPIHLDDMERIEVIRGPGSALYGANAHSAVVSISTRKIQDQTAEVFISTGEQDRQSNNLRLGHRLDDWLLQASGGLDLANHWHLPETRGRTVYRGRVRLDRDKGEHHTSIQLGLARADGIISSILGPSELDKAWYGDALVSHQAEHYRVQLSYQMQKAQLPISSHKDQEREIIHYSGINLGSIPSTIPFFNNNLDAQGQFNWSFFKNNLLILGGNYRWIFAASEEMLPGRMHQHRVGFFLQDEQSFFDQLFLTAGVRLDYNTITPFTVSPRASIIWRFLEDQTLRVAFGQAFRKPSFLNTSIHIKDVQTEPGVGDSFIDFFRSAVGNEELTNEKVTTVEAGYRGRFLDDSLSTELSFFYNRYRDTIAFHIDIPIGPLGPSFDDAQAQYENSGREVDTLGGSASLIYRYQKLLLLGANYTLRHSTYVSVPSGVGAEGDADKGDRVSWEPAHVANFFGHVIFPCGFRLGLSWHGRSAISGYYSSGGVFDPRVAVDLPASHFFNGFVAYRINSDRRYLEAGLRALNLFNMPFSDQAGNHDDRPRALGGELITRRLMLFVRGGF